MAFKYSKRLNNSIWPIDGTLSDATPASQSGPGSDNKEGVLHILQNIRCSLNAYSPCRDAVGVFYSPLKPTGIEINGVYGIVECKLYKIN